MSARPGPGVSLYFIDIFACVLFGLALALVSARFGVERTVPVALPRADLPEAASGDVPSVSITVREIDGRTQTFWNDEPIAEDAITERLERDAPPRVVIRMQESLFTRLLVGARAAGVQNVEVAYATGSSAPGARQ